MTDHLAALYRINVEYYPHEGVVQWGHSSWGEVEVTSADDDAWFTAWKQASVAERVQFNRWLANVISRAWAGVSGELTGPQHPVKLTAARHIVNPHLVVQNDTCTAYITFTVPDETANQWIARTKALVAEVITADQVNEPQPQRHTSVTLSDAQQERTP